MMEDVLRVQPRREGMVGRKLRETADDSCRRSIGAP
jgi:hypothetical protein